MKQGQPMQHAAAVCILCKLLPPYIASICHRDTEDVHSINCPLTTSYVAAMSASRRVSATLVHRSVQVPGLTYMRSKSGS